MADHESEAAASSVPDSMSAASMTTVAHPAREALWRGFVERCARGDRDAFTALYDATSPLVYSLALRIVGNSADAEEVTLDVYAQVWRDPGRFDGQRGSISSWLHTITRSRALDRYRSGAARRRTEENGPDVTDTPSEAASPEQHAVLSEERKRVARALEVLPREQRQLIEAAYFHGMTQSELARHFGLPLGTVKTRIRMGMLRLRERLGGRS
jgi:RNA polymerase sigma-70 factor (ECF subfamily)